MSKIPAPKITMPAYRNMRSPLVALAWPNRNAAAMLMTSPMKVSALGEMRVRASPCTMRSKSQPQAPPKALVQVILTSLLLFSSGGRLVLAGFVVDRRQFEDFQFAFAVGRHNGGHVAHLL